ncbi:MAG: exo-alpha-sialidase [Planctomycetia bacterium]|nr:exo-alpha-sialidase [Planctomycetia bacterium]
MFSTPRLVARRTWTTALLAGLLGLACCQNAFAAEKAIDLAGEKAGDAWLLLDKTASIQDGQLVLDGRRQDARAFYKPLEWTDCSLRAKFMVEPQDEGVLACGFVVRAADASTYYYVHFDRAQAILVRSDRDNSWSEIKRVGGLDKLAGKWHEGQLECVGDTLKVSLNGKLLFEAKDAALGRGRIGFYAGQGLVHVKDIVVSGEPAATTAEFKTPPPTFVHVCQDAGAGGYEAFPDVCRLSDGRLMAVFYAGYGHVALPNEQLPKGGRVSYCTSGDEGKTWSPAGVLYDGPNDDRDPSITQLKNGQLVCIFFSLKKEDAPGQSYSGLGTWIVTSDDLGKTWSPARRIFDDYYVSSPIRELSDGRLIVGLYREDRGTAFGAVGISDDAGKTWKKPVDIDNGGIRLDAETDVIECKDGSLYAVMRPEACYSVSKDRGESWTVSKPIGFPAHCPYLLRTKDDIILVAHRLPQTSLHYSLDECKTWSKNVPIDIVGGAFPSMVILKDGSVLVVYYEEGAGSSIRAKKFRATKNGIEWLTF